MDRPAHQRHPIDPKSDDTQQLRIFNAERIISQQLKDKIFRNCYPNNLRTAAHAEDIHTENDESIAYRNHACWVLESNIMSDDSEDDSGGFVSPHEATPINSQQRPQERTAKKTRGYPTKSAERASAETPWDDLFFFGDSDSSDYRSSELSDGSGFPIISGEELEKLLEEAKGTMQFHRWQNAPVGEHQKEFKTLVNLHKFSKETEIRNQRRWRSTGQAEEKSKVKATTTQNSKPARGWQRPENESEISHTQFPTPNPKSNLPTHIMSNKKPAFSQSSEDLKTKLSPVGEETEDYHITADDIKFLRELKKMFEVTVDTPLPRGTIFHGNTDKKSQKPQTSNESMSAMAMRKLMEYVRSEPDIAGLPKKSLRDVLRTAKPLLGRTEYENWFPQSGLEERVNESPRIYHGGPTPKGHHLTAPSGDVYFRPGSVEYHPFSQSTKSPIFKRLVMSTGKFWNPKADISLSGFWVTSDLFITALNFHHWAPSTTIGSLHNQIEDFKSRNDGIELFVSNSCFSSSDDPEAIKVVLRAWDTSARIAVFQIEDRKKASPSFVGVDMLIEEDAAYGHNGVHIATVGYNPLDTARGDPLGLKLLAPGSRSVTFGEITISEGRSGDKIRSPPVFARLESGFSHGSYGRMCIILEANQKGSGSIIGLGIYEASSGA